MSARGIGEGASEAKIREVLEKGAMTIAQRRFFDIGYSACESEIEKVMLAAFYSTTMMERWPQYFIFNHVLSKPVEELVPQCMVWIENSGGSTDCIVVPQVEVGNYRADFLCVGRDNHGKALALAVECDGHEFHEKTKEQAQRDKSRDRYFLSLRIQTMRFTGSEIWRDSLACVREVDRFFLNASYGTEVAA